MRFISLLGISVLFITGCKTIINTEVSLTDLLESESKTISGDLYVEVTGCNSYEDSRNPSSALIRAQQTIPSVFNDAEYQECFTKKFDSFAHFTIPVALDKDKDGKLLSEKHVNIIANHDTLLWVGIPSAIEDNIEKAKSNNFGAGSMELKVNIRVINDTGKDFSFAVLSAYIDDQPHLISELTVKQDASFVVTLSDVSVSHALKTGTAVVLSRL